MSADNKRKFLEQFIDICIELQFDLTNISILSNFGEISIKSIINYMAQLVGIRRKHLENLKNSGVVTQKLLDQFYNKYKSNERYNNLSHLLNEVSNADGLCDETLDGNEVEIMRFLLDVLYIVVCKLGIVKDELYSAHSGSIVTFLNSVKETGKNVNIYNDGALQESYTINLVNEGDLNEEQCYKLMDLYTKLYKGGFAGYFEEIKEIIDIGRERQNFIFSFKSLAYYRLGTKTVVLPDSVYQNYRKGMNPDLLECANFLNEVDFKAFMKKKKIENMGEYYNYLLTTLYRNTCQNIVCGLHALSKSTSCLAPFFRTRRQIYEEVEKFGKIPVDYLVYLEDPDDRLKKAVSDIFETRIISSSDTDFWKYLNILGVVGYMMADMSISVYKRLISFGGDSFGELRTSKSCEWR